jgi:translation initiation factor 3 subunit H
VPIIVKNSHLVNELLLELSEQIPVDAGRQFLDLGTADVLEEQLKHLIVSVDELNQVNRVLSKILRLEKEKAKLTQRSIFIYYLFNRINLKLLMISFVT